MKNLLDGMGQKNFVIVGRVGMDLYPDPPGTQTELATHMQVDMGGSAANIAAGLCKLGCNASLVTRVSDDAVGRFCVNKLGHYGVSADYVAVMGGEFRTSLAVYESRIQDHQTVLYRNGAADFEMNENDVAKVRYEDFGALITAGTVFAAEPSRTATFKSFELAKKAGLPIIFDVDYRPYSWPSAEVAADVLSKAASRCDMIVGNDEEFGFMAGHIDKGLDKARELAQTTASIVVYKMGEKGAITFAGDKEIHTGIYPAKALKPTGAGDSFMAGLLASLGNNHDLKSAIHRGSACASITVSRPGCAPAMPDETELNGFMAQHTQKIEK